MRSDTYVPHVTIAFHLFYGNSHLLACLARLQKKQEKHTGTLGVGKAMEMQATSDTKQFGFAWKLQVYHRGKDSLARNVFDP